MSESATERLARLLTLVPWLRAHDGITINETAQHFGVDAEQLTTDLWQLIVCGIPGYGPDQLVDIQFWDDDRIHVLDAIALERPLRLSAEEITALLVALRVLSQIPGSHDRQALVSAMAKLEEAGAPPIPVSVDLRIDPTVRDAVDRAVIDGSWLRIDYAAADGDTITTRRIRPERSHAVDDRVYVHAWCDVAADVRTFRLDRIHAAEVIEAPNDVDAESTTVDDKPMTTHQARISIDPQAMWIVDTEDVEPHETTHGREATVRYASLDWLVRWVLGHGGRVRVLEPEEAREAVRLAAQARLART